MRTAILVFVFVVNGWVVSAQTVCDTSCTAQTNEPVTVFTDAIACTSSCGLYMNGVYVNTPWAVNGAYLEFYFTKGLLVGSYSFDIRMGNTIVAGPNVLTVTDLCAGDPLQFQVRRWPAGSSGARRLDYYTDRAAVIDLDLRSLPWKATATDARGCAVTVRR